MTHGSPPNSEPLSLGALIRAEADGELNAGQLDQLEAARAGQADVDRRIAFERGLRAGVALAMGTTAAPVDLADRVRHAVATDDRLGERLEDLASDTRQRTFWVNRKITGAIAAVFVLALGLALVFQAFSVTNMRLDSSQLAYRQELAGFVAREHGRCCGDADAAKSKLKFSDPAEAAKALSDLVGCGVALPCQNRRPDLKFDGAGPCGIPGRGPSAHVMYEPEIGPKVSIFLKPDSGELPFEPGKTYLLDTKECGVAGTRIVAWVKDGIVYYAVFDEGPGCEQVLAELGIAPPTVKF